MHFSLYRTQNTSQINLHSCANQHGCKYLWLHKKESVSFLQHNIFAVGDNVYTVTVTAGGTSDGSDFLLGNLLIV